MNNIRSSSFLLAMTMLLFSACRTAHSVAKEESATQTAETSQSSVASESSFANRSSSLSLRADSIVLWMQPGETGSQTTVALSDSLVDLALSLCSGISGFTAQPSPTKNNPQVGKIFIGGLSLQSSANDQKSTSSLARDSLSARESHDSSLSDNEKSEPPNTHARMYIIIGAMLAVAIYLALRYLKKKYLP